MNGWKWTVACARRKIGKGIWFQDIEDKQEWIPKDDGFGKERIPEDPTVGNSVFHRWANQTNELTINELEKWQHRQKNGCISTKGKV